VHILLIVWWYAVYTVTVEGICVGVKGRSKKCGRIQRSVEPFEYGYDSTNDMASSVGYDRSLWLP
jgi:hypothetical protein